jgi:branched-chain amino acid transport system ATP-binding protein
MTAPVPEGSPVLAAEGLNAGYGALQILFDVSLHVAAEEHVLVFGPNGAGKSTLIKTLVGLVRPWSGRIEIAGRDRTRAEPEDIVLAGLGYVPQVDNVFKSLTVQENLHLGRVGAGDRAPRPLEEMYTLFPRLKERRHQRAGTLSGGERQMLAIARALIGRPALLLLDEPSAGIAPRLIGQIFETVAGLRGTGTAVLMVEQNARQALETVDRGVVLEAGAVRRVDAAPTLAHDPDIAALYFGAATG